MAVLMDEYGNREAELVCDLLLEHITGWSRIDRINNARVPFSAPQAEKFEEGIGKLQSGMPIQYVTGEAWFGEMKFIVSPAVLIPRPETDELVHWILSDHGKQLNDITLVDIGTGSGCIPIVCKKRRPGWQLYGCDISTDALRIAEKNANTLNAAVNFIQLDILNTEHWNKIPEADVLVSNPPYIPQKEKSLLQRQVQAFEPSLALFVPDEDPLIFYKAIAAVGQIRLKPEGRIYLECHEDFAEQTASLFRGEGYSEVQLREDMQGRKRMIGAQKR